jgi:hypothetical protein
VIVDGLKSPNTDTNPDPFTREEMNRIIEAYETHHGYSYFAPFVRFLFLTGCRTGEAVALRWKNVTEKFIIFCENIAVVRGKHIYLNSTKTGKDREFPRNKDSDLDKLLKQLKPETVNPDDFVFQQPGGGHINRRIFSYSWYGSKSKYKNRSHFFPGIVSKLASKTEAEGGIDHYRCPYSTRHTFITLALEKNKSISHSDISQLAKYVGNSPPMIYGHYLGRSGNEELVNLDFDSPSPQAPEDGKPSLDELRAQLATANQHINGLTSLVQTLTSSQKLPAPVEPDSEPELPVPTPSQTAPPAPTQPKGKPASQNRRPTKKEYEQFPLFALLEEMVNPKEE